MSDQPARCDTHGHIYGVGNVCIFCQSPSPEEPPITPNWELEARKLLWLNHGCNGHPYGDDGEMQCCVMDFKRWPWDVLMARVFADKVARLKQQQSVKEPPATTDPLVIEFRREVVDKLSVASHCGPKGSGGRTHKEIVLKQCEDFLVEQFESALATERQQHADAITELRRARIGDSEITGMWMCRAEKAEAALAAQQTEIDAARELIRLNASFQEWAQGYLDSGRWAGHDRADAVRLELLESDAEITRLTAERDELQGRIANALL